MKRSSLVPTHSEERQAFLDVVSGKLVTSLDHQLTLQDIAKLIVPYLADYCRIATIDEKNDIKEIVVHHNEKNKIVLAQSLYEQYKDQPESAYGIPSLLSKGKSEIIPLINDEVLKSFNATPEIIKVVKKIGLNSYIGVPLLVRNRIIGAITLSSSQPGRYYTRKDLKFSEEVARRIALTLENARLYSEAQKAIAVRDDFISIASHELKTPVTSLKMYTQVLHKESVNKGEELHAQYLNRMNMQIDKLTKLIEDLLNVSRIQMGKMEFNFEAFDIRECLEDIIETIQPTTSKKILLQMPEKSKNVWGDRDRIGQVITNLLTNAIKYSPDSNTIILTLEYKKKVAVIKVEDFGIGISKEDQQKIFDRFYRVSSAHTQTFPGLGIGLYISNEIIKRHNGEMSLKSKKGKGSIFGFTLAYTKKLLVISFSWVLVEAILPRFV